MAGKRQDYSPEIQAAVDNAYGLLGNMVDKYGPAQPGGPAPNNMMASIVRNDMGPAGMAPPWQPPPTQGNADAETMARAYQALIAQVAAYHNEGPGAQDLEKYGRRPDELERANYPGF